MSSSKRDNAYWRERLRKGGHAELLENIEAGKITVYEATLRAGLRKQAPQSVSGKLSYHWTRASHSERKLFVRTHIKEVNYVLREVGDDIKKAKAKRNGSEPGKSPTN